MLFFTYILESEVDGSFYIGQTNLVEDRLNRHNKGYSKSTSHKRPWKLLYKIGFESRSEAMKTEKYLKNLKKRDAILNWIRKQRDVAQRRGSREFESHHPDNQKRPVTQ